jgi:hypothetical protein
MVIFRKSFKGGISAFIVSSLVVRMEDLRVNLEEIVVSWSSRVDIRRASSRDVMGLVNFECDWRGEAIVVVVDGVEGTKEGSEGGLVTKPPPSPSLFVIDLKGR